MRKTIALFVLLAVFATFYMLTGVALALDSGGIKSDIMWKS